MAEEKPKLTKKQSFIQVLKFIAFSMGAGIIQIVSYSIVYFKFSFEIPRIVR